MSRIGVSSTFSSQYLVTNAYKLNLGISHHPEQLDNPFSLNSCVLASLVLLCEGLVVLGSPAFGVLEYLLLRCLLDMLDHLLC